MHKYVPNLRMVPDHRADVCEGRLQPTTFVEGITKRVPVRDLSSNSQDGLLALHARVGFFTQKRNCHQLIERLNPARLMADETKRGHAYADAEGWGMSVVE
jgi:hypothetical protein